MNTRALILAAGRGSRMGVATEKSHKCLTNLLNKPLLSWQLESLRKSGIDDITVIRGYKSELLKGDFKTIENPRWSETNMVATLFCAPFFNGDTIISYSDIVYKNAHINQLLMSPEDITITADLKWLELWEKRFDNPIDDAETFRSLNNKLIEIGGKPSGIEEIEAQYMGLIKLSKIGWQKMFTLYSKYNNLEKDKKDMTSLLADLIKNKVEISVEFVEGGWCEVDSYKDILIYEKELHRSSEWQHNWQ